MIQSIDDRGPLYDRGWDFYTVDLNSGVGVQYTYVGYQKAAQPDNPMTSVAFKAYDSAQDNSMPGSMPGWE